MNLKNKLYILIILKINFLKNFRFHFMPRKKSNTYILEYLNFLQYLN